MSFLETVESFNRKERFFLVGYALGNRTFALSDEFRTARSEAVGFEVPTGALAYMDYHLDWLHAAAYLHAPSFVEAAQHRNDPLDGFDPPARVNTGNQEDIDLVIAFSKGEVSRLVLVEAKADTGWTNKQLDSKARRLKAIFGDDGSAVPSVEPTFVLASPRESKGLVTDRWPAWMRRGDGRPLWMELAMPPGRRRVEGCDERGKPSAARPYFRIV